MSVKALYRVFPLIKTSLFCSTNFNISLFFLSGNGLLNFETLNPPVALWIPPDLLLQSCYNLCYSLQDP
ncbi:hypothetical protein CCY16_00136 [Wolbachia endosymbiont of Wuchereria bancrofti]|nr:hypothetical protein CCY16_00136 [Wolbachia endosymbiont of Wuchereria bancrofti]